MANRQSTNYARQKAHYGGIVGTIQQNAIEGVLLDKDPTNPIFKEYLPAGFLACDGRVYNVKDYYCLAQTLGIGDECRFKKEGVTLRNPDTETGDLGSFQVPDLGSKVMVGGRDTGAYAGLTKTNKPNINRVGVEVEASTNVGNTIICNYNGHMQIDAEQDIEFNGNIKYNMARETNSIPLSYTGNAKIDGDGKSSVGEGSSATPFANVNAFAGNVLEQVVVNTLRGEQTHDHTLTKPTSYPHNFKYKYGTVNVPLDDMQSTIDVDVETLDVLNQVVTPFIMVHYIIKF